MVFLGPLAVTLLPPSLTLLVFRLSSSQDVATEPSSEQQLCTLREHPTVAFAGESHFPLAPVSRCLGLEDLGLDLAGSPAVGSPRCSPGDQCKKDGQPWAGSYGLAGAMGSRQFI